MTKVWPIGIYVASVEVVIVTGTVLLATIAASDWLSLVGLHGRVTFLALLRPVYTLPSHPHVLFRPTRLITKTV